MMKRLFDDEVLFLFRIRHSHGRLFLHLRTVGLGSKDGIHKLGLPLQALECLLGSLLLCLFLGITCALLTCHALKQYLKTEDRITAVVFLLLQHLELHAHTVLLGPLQQL